MLICLAFAGTAAGVEGMAPESIAIISSSSEVQFCTIIVNGRTLTGPNSSAHRRDGLIFVPVSAVARSLGDDVKIDALRRTVTVRRQSGISAEFDARVGHIRENGSAILTISNAGEIVFPPNAEEFLLPVEIAAALFDVSIRWDADKNAVIIMRGRSETEAASNKIRRGLIEIYQADYDYSLNRYFSAASQNLTLTGVGRIADGRLSFSSNLSKSTSRRVSMRNVSFALERPNGQRFIAGDFGTGGNLQFLSANLRGASASVPVRNVVVTTFGGRAYSGAPIFALNPLISNEPFAIYNRFNYDTNVFGGFVSTDSLKQGRSARRLNFAAGALRFNGANRRGDIATGNVNYDSSRFRFQGDFGYGKFVGLRSDNSRVAGYGSAVELVGTFQATEELAFQTRYTNIGKTFLSPQSGWREPLDLKAAGVTWSPTKWLSTSFNASTARRPGDPTQNNRYLTSAFAITPSTGLPRFYVTHTQTSASQFKSGAFSTINVSKEFSSLRLYLNATRIKNIGPASVNAQIGANYAVNDRHAFEINQGIGSRGSLNGQFDWRTSNLLNQRLSLSAGVGYNRGASAEFSTYERLSASLILPRQTSLQVNYFHTNSGPTMLVSLRGSLFRRKEASGFLNSPVSEINSYGEVSGRVYQDIDQNGRFDAEVDKPQADVKVHVDGNRYVVSDANGQYKFDSVTAGDHKVYLDLLSVRADLTLLDEAARAGNLSPGKSRVYDFRLVRTGRVSGRVWLDANANGKFDKDETPLTDIRVVTASGRDTLTDAEGNFTIGDLPPGEHIFLLDEKTLPEKTAPGFKPLAVQVFPGRETSDIKLYVIATPAEVKRFAPRSESRL